jgi:hypothetical protein
MGKRKTTAPPSSSKPPDDGELDVEEFLEKNVERCRMKVDRLERDFSALIAHESLLNESFSVSTFPQGTLPPYNFKLSIDIQIGSWSVPNLSGEFS